MKAIGSQKTAPAASTDQFAQNRQVLFNAARKEANAFRGGLMDDFARFERSLAPVLLLASSLPEYAKSVKKPAHLLGQKIEQLRQIISIDGPLARDVKGLADELDVLCQYESMRHFMAHATLEVAQAENEDILYLFRMTRSDKLALTQSFIVFKKIEAKSTGAAVGAIVDRLTQHLDRLGNRQRSKQVQAPIAVALP